MRTQVAGDDLQGRALMERIASFDDDDDGGCPLFAALEHDSPEAY